MGDLGNFGCRYPLFPCFVWGFASGFSPDYFPHAWSMGHLRGNLGTQGTIKGPTKKLTHPTLVTSVAVSSLFAFYKCRYWLILLGICQIFPWSHNPEVVGSNPAPATIRKSLESQWSQGFFFFYAFYIYGVLDRSRPVQTNFLVGGWSAWALLQKFCCYTTCHKCHFSLALSGNSATGDRWYYTVLNFCLSELRKMCWLA